MEVIPSLYEDQTKIIENLYGQSYDKALEYVNLQIEKYGNFARGLLLYLIEISSEEELSQIVSMYKDARFIQQLKSVFTRNEESIYHQKYDEITIKIKECNAEVLSISKYISEGNAEKVHELLELGESPHSLVKKMQIKEYAEQYGNKQVIEEIQHYLDNEVVNKIGHDTLSISEMVEKLNSPKYTDIEKLSFILMAKPNKLDSEAETNSIISIKDDRLIETIRALYYKDDNNLINKFIENKEFKNIKTDNLAIKIMMSKAVITSKDLKEIFDITGNYSPLIKVLQKIEEGDLEEIKEHSLVTQVYHAITIGQLIGRMADLETIKAISANRNSLEISELLLGVILLDKKDCFDYLISLPVELTRKYNNLIFILKAQKFNYAEALANRYPKMRIKNTISEKVNYITGFWTYSKDLPDEHPLFSIVGLTMSSFVDDAPKERIPLLISKSEETGKLTKLFIASMMAKRFDIAAAILKKAYIGPVEMHYFMDLIIDWKGSDDEEYILRYLCRNDEIEFGVLLMLAAHSNNIHPLEILVSEQSILNFITHYQEGCAQMLLKRHSQKVFDLVHKCFTEVLWIIAATSPEIFKEKYNDIQNEIDLPTKALMGMIAILNNQHENLRFLLSKGLNPNSKGMWIHNKIDERIFSGDIFIGVNLPGKNIVMDMNEQLLVFSIKRGDLESFNILLDAGADLNIRNNAGESILLVSLKAGRQDIAEYLIMNNIEINHRELDALLSASCTKGYMSYAKFFIEQGANPTKEECLINAVKGPHIEIARMLMKSGCKPTPSALNEACETNCIPMIDLLFGYGLKVEKYAESNDTVEVVDALIRQGVKIEITEGNGDLKSLTQNKLSMKTIKLIESGTDLSLLAYQLLSKEYDSTPSFVISVLLDLGVAPNYLHDGKSLLSLACLQRNFDVVKLLVERGANIEMMSQIEISKNSMHRNYAKMPKGTPFVYACSAPRNRDTVSYLLEKGADPDPDSNPSDTIYYAAMNGYADILVPRCTEKANGNPKQLVDAVIFTFNRGDIDSAVSIVKLFMKTKYSEEDRSMICAMANKPEEDFSFNFIRKIIAEGFTFENFNVSKCESPDVAALCIEAGATIKFCPNSHIHRVATAMCTDVNSISNTEGNMFFIRRLPFSQKAGVFESEPPIWQKKAIPPWARTKMKTESSRG